MDPYQVLGLGPTASPDDAESAYHRLLRRHHPDLHQDGTADEVAAAEQRTRELNAAIAMVREGAGVTVSAGAGRTGADDPQPTGWRPGADERDTWGTWWGTADRAAWSRADMRPRVHCPTCGIELTSAVEFRVHVETAHDVREGGKRRRHPRRAPRSRTSASLWALVPFNILCALGVAGAIDALAHDEQLTIWASLVTMSPTLIRLVNGR